MRLLNFGSMNVDHVYQVEHFVTPGETISAHNAATRQLPPRYDAVWIGLQFADRAEMKALIDRRVDKMAEIVVTGLPREGEDRYPDFDVAAYGQKHFGMYSGEEASVTLRCRSHMAGVVWDRFGQDVILVPEDEDHFTVTLPLVLSPQFFGWLFGLEDNVELIAPQKAAEEYRRKLKAVLEQYG